MKKTCFLFLLLLFLCLETWANGNKEAEATGESLEGTKINVTIAGTTHSATLQDNVATRALLERLKSGEVVVDSDDYGGFEKVGTFGGTLPSANTQVTAQPGDFVLYHGSSISFFHEENSWSYTRLGKLDLSDGEEISAFLQAGKGSVLKVVENLVHIFFRKAVPTVNI